ncbi:hypothetical protein HDU82_004332 [Entophlyctis luteolus]|nr:hypothetical protein HDU82_004332 [Entophlyctis luteolus]KAJ3383982.1 hypothetical protein HDU84_003258 [Entophlyctis sp. JEL0112]
MSATPAPPAKAWSLPALARAFSLARTQPDEGPAHAHAHARHQHPHPHAAPADVPPAVSLPTPNPLRQSPVPLQPASARSSSFSAEPRHRLRSSSVPGSSRPRRSEFTRHPSWSPVMAHSLHAIRAILESINNDSLDLKTIQRTRSFANLGSAPSILNTSVQKDYIPRLEGLLIDDMAEEDSLGLIKSEWVENQSVASKNPEKVILYLHGGAYILCSRKTHRGITSKIAKLAECKVLVIDYRLAPEHVFPLALHDAISAYSFLTNPPPKSNCKTYAPENVVVMGDSAGGGLAMALLLWLRDHGSSINLQMPGGAGLLSPWLDLTHSMASFQHNGKWDYLPRGLKGKLLNENRSQYYTKDNSYLKNPLVSPLFAVESETAPMCPILIQIGENERLRDENLMFATKVFASSPIQLEIFESMVHVFQLFNQVDSFADAAMQRLCAFSRTVHSDGFVKDSFGRKVVYVFNKDGYPSEPLSQDDVDGYLGLENSNSSM